MGAKVAIPRSKAGISRLCKEILVWTNNTLIWLQSRVVKQAFQAEISDEFDELDSNILSSSCNPA